MSRWPLSRDQGSKTVLRYAEATGGKFHVRLSMASCGALASPERFCFDFRYCALHPKWGRASTSRTRRRDRQRTPIMDASGNDDR